MTEQDEQRPLSRRERRLREMAETGALDLSELPEQLEAAAEAIAAPVPAPATQDAGEIEISPFHEDGTPRSRREMRELREQAIAERGGADDAQLAAVSQEASAQDPAQQEAAEPAASKAHHRGQAADELPVAEIQVAESEVVASVPAIDVEPVIAVEPVIEDSAAAEAQGDAERAAESQQDIVEAAELAAAPEWLQDLSPETADTATPTPTAMDFDSLIAPPTEPFTVAELREAEQANQQADDVDAGVGESAADHLEDAAQPADEPTEAAEAAAEAESGKPKRKFWQRNKNATVIDPVPIGSEDAAPSDAASAPAGDFEVPQAPKGLAKDEAQAFPEPVSAFSARPAEPAAVDAEPVAPETPAAPTAAEEPAASAASKSAEAPVAESKESYSFPDIVPPEEWRSVFDDPASRAAQAQGAKPSGDFDDLISRAVAQEGSTTSTGTAALILPSMPEETGGLTGPLGGTGELYVTGSLKLPKSLGETGGHASLHDSIELHLDGVADMTPEEAGLTGSFGPAPVSARQAVSARVPSGIPVVAKPAKERSKLPLVLSLTGGGLLVAVIVLGAWGASQGVFG